ncbi:hypothetical protein, partial [Rhodococcus erythropolis]|uniref:hypothetical protein n=1 Tax=Rhodococcus erythropolis TaxID=1833 RepID=UPI001BEAEDEA
MSYTPEIVQNRETTQNTRKGFTCRSAIITEIDESEPAIYHSSHAGRPPQKYLLPFATHIPP